MKTLARSSAIVSILLACGAAALVARATSATAPVTTMVFCAPGYPGSTVEAQPAMNGFAAAVSTVAGWQGESLHAQYFETEAAGVERLRQPDAAIALVTLPFFLEHQQDLNLKPFAQAVPSGRAPNEPWSLVAGAGRIHGPDDLADWQLISLGGQSPRFVRGAALGAWGELPESVSIVFSGAILSGLRRAAKGETVAMLLDGSQTGSLARLPFADDLAVVYSSPPLPVSLVCTVAERMNADRQAELDHVLIALDEHGPAAEALAGVRIDRFVELDIAALQTALDGFAQ